MPADFPSLLKALTDARVKFVVVGGMAMVSYGSAFVTADLDICYARDRENLEALVKALAPFRPRLRGAPEDLPFRFDARTIKFGMNFTFKTDAGDIDMLGEVTGLGGYDALVPGSVELKLFGLPIRIMGLDDLIHSKRAAGRDKDRLHLKELEEIKRRSKTK